MTIKNNTFTIQLGPQGAMGPTISPNTVAGTNGPPGPTLSEIKPMISLTSKTSTEVLRITHDGDVLWFGKPSEASDALIKIIGHLIDGKHSKSMRKRTYMNAYKSILEKAKRMDKHELIDFLEKTIQNREYDLVKTMLEEDLV